MPITDIMTTGWTVQRSAQTINDGVVEDGDWSDLHTSKLGHIAQLSFSESRKYARVVNDIFYRVYLEYTAGIEALTDRLVGPDGQIYGIVGVNNPHGLNEFLQIDVVRGPVEMDDENE